MGERLNSLRARAHSVGLLKTEFDHDWQDDTLIVKRVQDVEPHIDHARMLQVHDHRNGYNADKSRQHVAHIPHIIVEQWRLEGFDMLRDRDWEAKLLRKLRDPSWAWLRVSHGRI